MVSRVLGFLRDMMIAAVLGAGPVTDAFLVALRFPNLFRRLFGEGAFSIAFVPMFARAMAGEGRDAARAFAEQALSLMTCGLLVFVVAVQAGMPLAIFAIAPGFSDDPVKLDLAITLSQITFPYLLLIAIVALLGGVLNALDRFAAMAATAVLFNIVLIGAMALSAPDWGLAARTGLPGLEPGTTLAWGVTISGCVQLVWMVWNCRRARFDLHLRRPRLTPQMRKLLALMGPALVSHGAMQINLLVGTVLASFLATGAITYLYLSDRVVQLPLGVVGVAVATALLPKLSRALRLGDSAAASDHQNRAVEIALLLTLPATAGLIVLAAPVTSALFERQAFTAEDAAATAEALVAYAWGLPAFVLVKVFATPFFAREDTKTPFKITLATVLANIVLSAALMFPLGHTGLAWATTVSGWLNVVLLLVALHRQDALVVDTRLRRAVPRLCVAVAAMTGLLLTAGPAAQDWAARTFGAGDAPQALVLVSLIIAGGGVYGAAAIALGAARLREVKALVRR